MDPFEDKGQTLTHFQNEFTVTWPHASVPSMIEIAACGPAWFDIFMHDHSLADIKAHLEQHHRDIHVLSEPLWAILITRYPTALDELGFTWPSNHNYMRKVRDGLVNAALQGVYYAHKIPTDS